jgi:hypothetical protein
MKLTWMILAATLTLSSGCATKALLKAANGEARENAGGEVRVLSASRSGNNAYLCFQRTSPGREGETYSLLIPTAESRDFAFRDSDSRQPLIRVPAEQLMRLACKTTSDSIPVIEIADTSQLVLKQGQRDAVYVQYVQGRLQNLGYVSAKPLFDSLNADQAQHGYALDLRNTEPFTMAGGGKRPYLLLLLPVSVATDVVTGAGVVVVAFAKSMIDDCTRKPETKGCKGP